MEPALSRTAADVARVTRSRAAFELKGVMAPLTVLRLKSKDLNLIDRQLRAKLAQMPQFFQDAPVVIDPAGVPGGLGALPLQALVTMLRSCRVVPVGVINIGEDEREAARSAGLGVPTLGAGKSRRGDAEVDAIAAEATSGETEPAAAAQQQAPEPGPSPAANAQTTVASSSGARPQLPTVVIREPVRSGQEIYVRDADLIVTAPVNPGAQIFADGNVHVYSTLRGRAMAGAQGFTQARIFVQKLEAEMIAVAGAYLLADEMPQERRGKPAQVYLENGECRVGPL